jgi:hypothetical protein
MEKPITFLRLYVDPAWRRKEGEVYSEFMYPFWGVPAALATTHPQTKELFDTFQFDTRYYSVTDDITKADAIFPPYSQQWLLRRDPALLDECARAAASSGLPLLVDGRADGEPLLNIPNSYILRIGGYRFDTSEVGRIEIAVPADDLLIRYVGEFSPRKKKEGRPTVGFAGMIRDPKRNLYRTARSWVKQSIIRLPLYLRRGHYPAMDKGVYWRRKAIHILENSTLVECNFKTRDYFSGSVVSAPRPMKELQKEMIDIILGSDYALDVRGFANASTRLFEILSLGRIPVILDTERILPFANIVDWSKFSLIIDFRDIARAPQIIADFHASLSPQQFEDMQRAARDAFVNYFRVDAEMPHILSEFNSLRTSRSSNPS